MITTLAFIILGRAPGRLGGLAGAAGEAGQGR